MVSLICFPYWFKPVMTKVPLLKEALKTLIRRAVSRVTQDKVTVPPAAVEMLPIAVEDAAKSVLVTTVVGQPIIAPRLPREVKFGEFYTILENLANVLCLDHTILED